MAVIDDARCRSAALEVTATHQEYFCCTEVTDQTIIVDVDLQPASGEAIGCAEGWRGPVLYWLKTNRSGIIERCKIVDPSFHNWQGLSYAVLGNIIPDFPLCNKSFDLSYAGNDL